MGVAKCKVVTDLRYSSESDTCKLDIYYPKTGTGHSVVIFIHGGGWTSGSKDAFPYPKNAKELASRGSQE